MPSNVADAGIEAGAVDGIIAFQTNDSTHPLDVSYALGRDELSWSPRAVGERAVPSV